MNEMRYKVKFDTGPNETLEYFVTVSNSDVFEDKYIKSDGIRIVERICDLFPTSRVSNISINKILTSTADFGDITFNRIK